MIYVTIALIMETVSKKVVLFVGIGPMKVLMLRLGMSCAEPGSR